MRTVLARILETADNKWDGQVFNVITLIELPREVLRVYAGELTKKQFDELSDKAHFIVLDQHHNAQLEYIHQIIPPFAITRYQNSV